VKGKGFLCRWRPALLAALVVTIALAPLPALAGEPSPPAAKAPPGIRASLAKLDLTERIAAPRPPTARKQQAGQDDLRSASFFKSPLGIVVLATLGVGAGYAIYSTQHDRIHSAGK